MTVGVGFRVHTGNVFRVLLISVLVVTTGCVHEKAEGRPWIHKITFEGVHHVKTGDLKKHIAIDETSWFPFAPKHYLDPFAIDIDRTRIEAYYREHGYYAAKVTDTKTTNRDKKGKSVDITFTVLEGPPTKIAAAQINGLEPLGEDAKKPIAHLNKVLQHGAIFEHHFYLEEKLKLKSELEDRGYAWAQVDGSVTVDRDRQQAQILYQTTPGLRATFGTVTVDGTKKTDPRKILIHADLPIGQRYKPEDVEDARGRVFNLGVFSSVRFEHVHDPEHPDVADMIIHVEESTFHELKLGGGLGIAPDRFDGHLVAAFTKYNFLGGFRRLQLTLKPGWVFFIDGSNRNGPVVTVEATLTQPDFIWRRLELKWTVGFDVGIEAAYQYYGPRTSLGISRPFWRQRLNLGFSYNFLFWSFFNLPDPTLLMNNPALAGRLYGYTDPYRVGWFQEDIIVDFRDRPLEPHKGVYAGLSAELGGEYAGGAFWYEKLTPDGRFYIPLGKRVTVAGRAQYGRIYMQSDLGSPISRRYYLGGPDSHRGFNFGRLAPQAASGTKGIPAIPVGGDEMILFQGEIRAEVLHLFGNWMSVGAFWDGGDVVTQSALNCDGTAQTGTTGPSWAHTIDWKNLHHAVGAGLRYATLIGTIRADVGVRLNRLLDSTAGHCNPDPNERVVFHISIGEAF